MQLTLLSIAFAATAVLAQLDPLSLNNTFTGTCRDTRVQYGRTSINYGTIGAGGSSGILHHLYELCHEQACEGNNLELQTTHVNRGLRAEVPVILKLRAEGQYGSYEERNAMIELIVAAAGVNHEVREEYYLDRAKPPNDIGPIIEFHQANDLSVNVVSCNPDGSHNVNRFMHVTVLDSASSDGWCAKIAGTISGIAGLVSAVPEFAAASAAISGFMGAIAANC